MEKPRYDQITQKIEAWRRNPQTTYTPGNILQDHANEILNMSESHQALLAALKTLIESCSYSGDYPLAVEDARAAIEQIQDYALREF
jgi:hypothetical protein